MTNDTNDISRTTQLLSEGAIRQALTRAETAALVAELEKRDGYRVLHELSPLPLHRCGPHDGLRCAIVVDTESTGLVMPGTPGAVASELVSMAMVAIAYDPADGDIKGAVGRLHRYREPAHPIPPAATAIHGITDAMVKGCRITDTDVAEFIALCASSVQDGVVFGSRDEARLPLIIAHNASFDRQLLEHHFPTIFPDLPWACSQSQVPWSDHGYEGTKLFYLAFKAAFYYGQRHSALADADAVVELLRQKLGGKYAMSMLRDASQQSTHRLSVVTRYDPAIIAALKERGYRWNASGGTQPKSWSWQGDDDALTEEIKFLDQAGFGEVRDVRYVDCFDRFSRGA
jgi:DNA polymerase-3 subunit epsilon